MLIMRRRFLLLGLSGVASLTPVVLASKGLSVDEDSIEFEVSSDLAPFNLPKNPEQFEPIVISDNEWRQRLNSTEYAVLRERYSERAGSSSLNAEDRDGEYVCAACGLLLFRSEAKYYSQTGWPSFYDGVLKNIGTSLDFSIIYPRTEYHCKRCGGHQGYFYKNGPKPTGVRYCNNGSALRFIPA